MFDAPLEDWYVWVGVAAVSLAVLGVAVSLPSAAPPKAAAVADAIDRVATSPTGSTGVHEIRAEEIKLDRTRVSLRDDGGTAHAEVAFGPVTPAGNDERLEAVLAGERPRDVFESPEHFAVTAKESRTEAGGWRAAPQTLEIRRVSWEGIDVLLVG